jgi:hypothetical protein
MAFKKSAIIPITAMILLLVSLTACSPQAEDAEVKPLTKDQVLEKVVQQVKKQTNLPATQYNRKEALIAGVSESKIYYYGDKEYYIQQKDASGYDDQTYQFPTYQYTRHIYEKDQKVQWKRLPFENSFKEEDLAVKTPSGKIDDLKAQTYLSILQEVASKIQMKENPTSYELDFTSTEHLSIFKWMNGYLQNFGDVIDPNGITFTKYHTKMTIDKKTFAVQAIANEVYFTRETLNLDNGQKGKDNLHIQTTIQYPKTKHLVVPDDVKKEGDSNDPTNPIK